MLSSHSQQFPNVFRVLFRDPLTLEKETGFFLLASILDASITYFLLQGGPFEESNPVARFFLYRWGHAGMVYFKFSMVAVVCTIAQIVACQRVQTARRLMIFAAVTVSLAVAYSIALFQYSKTLPIYN